MEEAKWQRVTYMPGTPLGEDGRRITGCREHIELSRRAAAEGMVLLKNEEDILPLKEGSRLALFGKGCADYVKGGGGSGDTTVAYVRNLIEGLEIKGAGEEVKAGKKKGRIELFAPLCDFYSENVKAQYAEGKEPGKTIEPKLSEELVKEARAFADTALIDICRFSSEGADRTGEAFDGDFYLSHEEADMVELVKKYFDRIIVVLNTGGMMDTLWFKDEPKIKAALLAWQGGMEGGLAAADILLGDVCPSGHLTDTFAVNFDAYPSSENFNESEDYVEYTEDIYVGYRYFETMAGAKDKVAYPFGYGLTYTSMEIGGVSAREEHVKSETAGNECDRSVIFNIEVKNTGKRSGREVVQIYCEAPKGKLGKAKRVLCGFKKTGSIEAGESEIVEIQIDPYAFSSYDDKGAVCENAYVLEAGEYHFHIGFNVRDTNKAEFVYKCDEDVILERLSSKCGPKKLHKRMLSDGSYEELLVDESIPKPGFDEKLIPFDGQSPMENEWVYSESLWAPRTLPALIDVYEDKMTLDEFMELLSDEQKISLLGGQPNRGVANTCGFGNLPKYGVPNVMTADGPQGLRFEKKCGVTTTAIPCASLMACSWDPELVYEVNRMSAREVHENGIGVWLTPAINIHRTPLCGRNFEYFSEDPFLAGKMASAAVMGIQSEGVAASVKHFVANNKETNRRDSDSRVSERALREIYLKPFEICVKEAQPWTLMSAYNIVNGVRASENRELLTDILRGEWGFGGMVTSDWCTHGRHYEEINAGNDVKMCIGMPKDCMEALKDGRLDRKAVDESVRRVLEMILKLR